MVQLKSDTDLSERISDIIHNEIDNVVSNIEESRTFLSKDIDKISDSVHNQIVEVTNALAKTELNLKEICKLLKGRYKITDTITSQLSTLVQDHISTEKLIEALINEVETQREMIEKQNGDISTLHKIIRRSYLRTRR